MTTLNVPTISRKKPGLLNLHNNSFRVFGEAEQSRAAYRRPHDVPDHTIDTYDRTLKLPSWQYNSHYEPERNVRDRNHCEVTYLRRNVRTLNDPVCYVPSAQEEEHWWPGRVPPLTKPSPPKTKDSTMRSDYDWTNEHQTYGSNRHKHHISKPALGAVPVNYLPEKDGHQRFFKERISYEHQYDSRFDKNYPIRSARHGAYVSQPITAEMADKLLKNPAKWRVDTQIKDPQPIDQSAITTTTGVLAGLPQTTHRNTTFPNRKHREHFDIAPRSNLNVRVKEYVPSITSIMSYQTQEPKEPSANGMASPCKFNQSAVEPTTAVPEATRSTKEE
ncbi:uncharacterized protein [Watersipora subatra]|uniref:uncharacterized protein isoform X2 n=1 Tax=Watersipora subatra TaxID=2589382 RepID=UPI00355B3846